MRKRSRISRGDSKDLRYFRGLVSIDREVLDEELASQPTHFFDLADEKAEAMNRRDMSNEEQKQVKARLVTEVRNEQEKDGRTSKERVEAEVELHPEYIAAREKYKDASRELVRWEGAQEAFRQRASMLRGLAELRKDTAFQSDAVRDYDETRRKIAERRRGG